jgi:hypothetical protein
MLLLSGGGTEAFVLMPTTFDVSPLSSHIRLRNPGTIPYKREVKLTFTESPSCGSGEIPNPQRYSYHPLEL